MDKKIRNSSFELLRIICIFMVIACHFAGHGYENMLVYGPQDVTFQIFFRHLIGMWGRPACMIFSFISAYHLIQNKNKSIVKKVASLIAEMMFYGILVFLLAFFVSKTATIKDLIPSIFAFLGNYYWYFKTYLVLLCFVPFINPFLTSISKGVFRKLVLTIFVLYFLINTFSRATYFSELFWMFNCYCIGAYYSLYGQNEWKIKNKYNLLISFGFAFIIIASVVSITMIGIIKNSEYWLYRNAYFTEFCNVFTLGFSFFLFVYFSNKKFENKIINTIASTTGGIYLLHDNCLIYPLLWQMVFPNINYLNTPYFYLQAFLKIVGIFVVGVIVDLIRQKVFARFMTNTILKIVDSITKFINKKFPKFTLLLNEEN